MPNDKDAEYRTVLTTGPHSRFDDASAFSDRCQNCSHSRANHLNTMNVLDPAGVKNCNVQVALKPGVGEIKLRGASENCHCQGWRND